MTSKIIGTLILVVFVEVGIAQEESNHLKNGQMEKEKSRLNSVFVSPESRKILINQDHEFREFFRKKNWDTKLLDRLDRLKLSAFVRECFHYDLVDPAFAFANRTTEDSVLLHKNGLIPIGMCGNGDFLLVCVASDSNGFQKGAVYIMAHDHALERGIENPTIIPEISRLISKSIKSFLTKVMDENADLPMDYLDGNPKPYRHSPAKKAKMKARSK